MIPLPCLDGREEKSVSPCQIGTEAEGVSWRTGLYPLSQNELWDAGRRSSEPGCLRQLVCPSQETKPMP